MDFSLNRFKEAQTHAYDQALSEIRRGRKTGHWMWYVFPQLRGLGRSGTADYYGIVDLEEAKAYLDDPILGPRLTEISEALMQLEEKDAGRIFGYPDELKLRSCMTLFEAASPRNDNVFSRVLDAFYNGERDGRTLELLKM